MNTEKDILHIRKEESRLTPGQREYLVYPNEYLVPGALSEQEEYFEIALDTDGLRPAASLTKDEGQDRYRFLIAAASLAALTDEYSFSMNPENLMYDASMTPKVRHRDRGAEGGDDTFAASYKALIASLLEPKSSYSDYYSGGADLYGRNKILKDIAPLTDIKEITARLKEALSLLENKLKTGSLLVERTKYQTLRTLMIVFICLFAALSAFALRYYLTELPDKELAIDIGNKFLAGDYIGVIQATESKNIDVFSKEERYMSAYSSAMTAGLSDKQKSVAMRDITLSTDSLLLDFWIEMGRGRYEAAIDIAQRIGDSELEYYGLVIYKDAVSVDKNISGADKTNKLKSLDDQISALEKQTTTQSGEK